MKYLTIVCIGILMIGCKPEMIECTDPYAINYNKKGEKEHCVYPANLIKDKTYNLRLVYYPAQSTQEGEEFTMQVINDYCPGFELFHAFTGKFLGSYFDPYYICFDLNKDMSFTHPDSLYSSWAGGDFEFDSCRFFSNNYDSVIIVGHVYHSGDPYPAIFKSF
jgi:hypothetical protein